MLDSILQFTSPILAFLATKYGPVGMALGYLFLFGLPLVSVLIELAEALATLTASTEDDAKVADIKAKWALVVKSLEVLPHINIPLAPVFVKILDWSGKILGWVKSIIPGLKS